MQSMNMHFYKPVFLCLSHILSLLACHYWTVQPLKGIRSESLPELFSFSGWQAGRPCGSHFLYRVFVVVTVTVFLQSWGRPSEPQFWPNGLALRPVPHPCQTRERCSSWGDRGAPDTKLPLVSLLISYTIFTVVQYLSSTEFQLKHVEDFHLLSM